MDEAPCDEPGCDMPTEPYQEFTMDISDDLGEGLVLFEKVRCLGGHHYVREVTAIGRGDG
jgi:hypothetical protein